MTNFRKACALCTLFAVLSGGASFAQDRDDHRDHRDDQRDARHDDRRDDRREDRHDNRTYVRHNEWKKGYHMRHEDWDRGDRIDYRTYHLRRPPSGYEWRLVDGSYVLAAVATGVIASIVIAAAANH